MADQRVKTLIKAARLAKLQAGGSKVGKQVAGAASELGLSAPVIKVDLETCKPWEAPKPFNASETLANLLKPEEIEPASLERIQMKMATKPPKDSLLYTQLVEKAIASSSSASVKDVLNVCDFAAKLPTEDEELVNRFVKEMVVPLFASPVPYHTASRIPQDDPTHMRYEMDLATLRGNLRDSLKEGDGKAQKGGMVQMYTLGMAAGQYLEAASQLVEQGCGLIVSDLTVASQIRLQCPKANIVVGVHSPMEVEGVVRAGFPVVIRSERELVAAKAAAKTTEGRVQIHLEVSVEGSRRGVKVDRALLDNWDRREATKELELLALCCMPGKSPEEEKGGLGEFARYVSGLKNVRTYVTRYTDSPDYQAFSDFWLGHQVWGLSNNVQATVQPVGGYLSKPVMSLRSRCLPNSRPFPGRSKTKKPDPAGAIVSGGQRQGLTGGDRKVLIDGAEFVAQVEGREAFVFGWNQGQPKESWGNNFKLLPAVWQGTSGDFSIYAPSEELARIPAHVPRVVLDSETVNHEEGRAALIATKNEQIEKRLSAALRFIC